MMQKRKMSRQVVQTKVDEAPEKFSGPNADMWSSYVPQLLGCRRGWVQ